MKFDRQAVWRWHFYAGIFCIPFIVLLAVTGSIYLFKPQLDARTDHSYDELIAAGPAASAEAQVHAALAQVPGSRLDAYVMPQAPLAAVQVLLRDGAGRTLRAFVDPVRARVLAVVPEEERFVQVIKTLHGELLLGDGGSVVVELAASWAIVMVITGLYLWWPRDFRLLGGVLYPRLGGGGRRFWRDLHAVTGVWISFLALFLLLSALPWTNVWGDGFKELRRLTGTALLRQDWDRSRSTDHAAHSPSTGNAPETTPDPEISLDEVLRRVAPLEFTSPVLISPPTASDHAWKIRSDSQNRPLRQSLKIDAATGAVLARESFADRHVIDRIVGVAVAAHEGQLFAPLNQVLGVLTAAGLVTLCVSAVVMWWRRRPEGELGAPVATGSARRTRGLATLVVGLGLFLPVLGMSLVAVAIVELLVLRRIPAVRAWLGLVVPDASRTAPG